MLRTVTRGDGRMAKLYSWQLSYQDALLELNPEELRTKIDRAISELEMRSRELMFSQDAGSFTERQAIVDALNGLHAIQRHELVIPFDKGGQVWPIST